MFSVRFLILPLVIFSFFMQARIWQMIWESMRENMDQELQTASLVMDMTLDTYTTILYDFCTDDELVDLVEKINEGAAVSETDRNYLRRRLDHLGNQLDGIEGVTLLTAGQRLFFYDRGIASFTVSTWADQVKIPEIEGGFVYQSGATIQPTDGGKEKHLLQIARRIVDYRDINRAVGTVVLSIDQEVFWDVIPQMEDSRIYICDGEQVIASKDFEMIDQMITTADTAGYRIDSLVNERTGWLIYDYYSMKDNQRALLDQTLVWIVCLLVIGLFGYAMLTMLINPVLAEVQEMVSAMQKMEEGDYSVRVDPEQGSFRELNQIAVGFNELAGKTDELRQEARRLLMEQRTAELSALEAQIDPHFLYNTLDTINWKAIEHEDYEVSSMIGALADIMQYSMQRMGETITFWEEVEWLKQYITLQKERLTQKLELIIEIPDELMDYRIHKLLLQPFVENAVRHGFHDMKEECRLRIHAHLTGRQVHIIIEDNGAGMKPEILEQLNRPETEMTGHVGITNVRKRLELYYGEDAGLYFESGENAGTTVHLFVSGIPGGQ